MQELSQKERSNGTQKNEESYVRKVVDRATLEWTNVKQLVGDTPLPDDMTPKELTAYINWFSVKVEARLTNDDRIEVRKRS